MGEDNEVRLLQEDDDYEDATTGSSGSEGPSEAWDMRKHVMANFQNAAKDKWRVRKDQQLCASSLGCLVLIVTQNILIWRFALSEDPDAHRIMVDLDAHPMLYVVVWVLNALMIFLTLLSLIFLTQYYRQSYLLKREKWRMCRSDIPPNRPKLLLRFALEVTIQLIYPYPFLPRSSFLYQLLVMGMFLRLYIVFRVLHTSSHAFRRRAQIRSQYQDFRRMDLKVSWDMTIKMAFYKYMWAMVALSTVLIIFVLAFCLYVLERETDDEEGLHAGFSDLGGCLWFSFVTFTTIGYGDMVPKSTAGRVVTVLLGTLGQVVIATFGGVVTNKLTPTKTQQLMTEYVENQDAEAHYKRAAATLIQSVWRVWVAKKRSKQQNPLLYREGKKFRQRNRELLQVAVKRFMRRRYQLAKSSLQAIDPVVDQKLDAMNTMLEAHSNILNRLVAHLEAGSPLASTQNTSLKQSTNFLSSYGSRRQLFRKGSARRSSSITGLHMVCERPQTPLLGNSVMDMTPALDVTPAPQLDTPPDPALRKKRDSKHLGVEDDTFSDAMRLPSNATLPVFDTGDTDDKELTTDGETDVVSRNTRSFEDSFLRCLTIPVESHDTHSPLETQGLNPLVLNVSDETTATAKTSLPRSPRMKGAKWKKEDTPRVLSSASTASVSSTGNSPGLLRRGSLPSLVVSPGPGDPRASVLSVPLRQDMLLVNERAHMSPPSRRSAFDL